MDSISSGAAGSAPDLGTRIAAIQARLALLSTPPQVATAAQGAARTTTGGTDFAAQLAQARRATGTSAAPPAAAAAGRSSAPEWALPVDGRISSRYGMRQHPVTGVHKLHTGLDIAASSGTRIGAAGSGVVTFAGSKGGFGNTVVVDHGDGTSTLYAHASTLLVGKGDTVRTGEPIARVGSTGLSTGPHLHFEVRRDDVAVDPLPWLRERGVTV